MRPLKKEALDSLPSISDQNLQRASRELERVRKEMAELAIAAPAGWKTTLRGHYERMLALACVIGFDLSAEIRAMAELGKLSGWTHGAGFGGKTPPSRGVDAKGFLALLGDEEPEDLAS
jgi:hypothetical protein